MNTSILKQYADNFITSITTQDIAGVWNYDRDVIEHIIVTSHSAKSALRNILSRHPLYDEKQDAIIFSSSFTRLPDLDAVHNFKWYLIDICNPTLPALYEYAVDEVVRNIMRFDATDATQAQYLTETEADNINIALEQAVQAGAEQLAQFHVHRGQKRSKVVGKLCRLLGYDKRDGYAQRFAVFGDAMNPLDVQRFTVISLNPVDFLNMSHGTSWSSCHNPNKETYSGCNCSGGISHALDNTSVLMYTCYPDVDKDNLAMQAKVDRCVFFVDPDEPRHVIQSRMYPSYEQEEKYREIFQMVLSECLEIPNLWTKRRGNGGLRRAYGATCYPDADYVDRNHINEFYHSEIRGENFNEWRYGAKPIDIVTGERHSVEDSLTDDVWTCQNCGAEGDEEDERYSEFYGEYGCSNCMSWSEFAGDYFWDTDDWEYVRSLHEYIPVPYMEDNSDFAQCEGCGEWIYIPYDMCVEIDGEYYCEDCADRYLVVCEECGEYVKMDDAVEINGDYYCEYCADAYFVECEECGEIIRKDDAVEIDGKYYCEDCAENISEEQEENEVA